MAYLLWHSLILKGIAMTFWLAFLSTAIEKTDCCRPHCTGSYCVTVHRVKVDFETADEICRRSEGELLSLVANDDILHTLDYGGYGNFWIGLSLPDGTCSDLSAPLRGYRWASSSQTSNVSFNFWGDNVQLCSPRCVSTSPDLKWTERPCLEEIDGFLCKTDHEHACQIQELQDYFRSASGCSDGPCEHNCHVVKDGYRCSCYEGYAPDPEDPRRCKLHCTQQKCPTVCDEMDRSICSCPVGYIKNEHVCEDIDECEMEQCAQKCKNSYGSFKCSCYKGFVLQDQVKCVPTTNDSGYVDFTTPIVPEPKNSTLKVSSLSRGGFIWLWIFIVLLVIASVCVVRWYALKRQRRAQQNSTQVTVTKEINTQCQN
ncbi:thrombomodulin-like [Boleophthalmus pectinirostris]|uniref:thrombomodulin-like n=1 Tax=Boleophthalmus pectinirostris TaxID=150288 RepID=UPI0024328BC0|nr:thrombomodulin-like [Boleophthalmus pectinirostris]